MSLGKDDTMKAEIGDEELLALAQQAAVEAQQGSDVVDAYEPHELIARAIRAALEVVLDHRRLPRWGDP